MIISWMISATVLGTIIAIGSSFVARIAAYRGLPRRWLVLSLMALSLVLPAVLAVTHRPAPVPMAPQPAQTQPTAAIATEPSRQISADTVLLIGWATLSVALLALLAATDRRIRAELAACRHQRVLGVAVTVSRDFGPAAVGLIRPRVVLPAWALDRPHDELRLVLRHELEHLRAGDQFVLAAGVTMAVLMPWNPALWWQLRRLRVAMELDCDRRVTVTPSDRPRYAQVLLDVRTARAPHQMVLALAPAPSALTERLVALLERARPSAGRIAVWSLSALACGLIVTRVPVPSLLPAMVRQAPAAQLKPFISIPLASDLRGDTMHQAAKAIAHQVRATTANSATPAAVSVPHPRYDSLVPYVPDTAAVGRAFRALGRGVYVGGGGMARSVPADTTLH
jgi:beta-lactamase regulating signal transducer with metallopeptidase domain